MKLNLGVMFGGKATEHEISVISAIQAINNLNKDKYNIIPLYLSKDNTMYFGEELKNIDTYKDLKNINKKTSIVNIIKKNNEFLIMKMHFPYKILGKLDLILPIFHGYNTEDGTIAGYLEMLGIPYCESDIYASVIGQDKIMQKQVLASCDIPVVNYRYFYESEYQNDAKSVLKKVKELAYPMIIKPARQGSSVGIKVATDDQSLQKAIESALNYDEKILVEEVIDNLCELNCSVLGDNYHYEPSQIEEVYSSSSFLTFEDKYLSDGGKKGPSKGMASAGRKVPAEISKTLQKKIENYSVEACKALNTSGIVRIDYLLNKKTEEVYLNELNIIPGSLSFYLWSGKGVDYSELLDRIIDCGIQKYKNKAKKFTSFDTNVLEGFNGTKGIKK